MSSVRPGDRMRQNSLPTHRLKLTDIVGVELVNSYECANSGCTESPCSDWTNDRELSLVHVVNENAVELHKRGQYSCKRLIMIG